MSQITTSIIIICKDAGKDIDILLNKIYRQKKAKTFEVIAIDSGSTDKTLKYIKNYNVRLCKIRPEEFHHSKTRNLGANLAKGKYLCFITQDALPKDDYWLYNLTRNFKDKKVAGVCSRIIPRPDANPITKISVEKDLFNFKKRTTIELKDKSFENPYKRRLFYVYNDVSSCMRKEIWKNIPYPVVKFGEDIAWARKVIDKGYKIVLEPKSIVEHSHDYTIRQIYKRCTLDAYICKKIFSLKNVDSIKSILILTKRLFIRDLKEITNMKISIKEKIFYICYSLPYHLSELLGHYKGSKR